MNQLRKPAILSGLDLNVVAQTLSFLRIPAKGSHASRHARVCAGHGPCATHHVSPLRSGPPGRSQGARVLVLGSVLRHGLRPVDGTRVVARYRSQPARAVGAAVSHGISLQVDCAQHAGPCERDKALADLCRFRATPDRHRPPTMPTIRSAANSKP